MAIKLWKLCTVALIYHYLFYDIYYICYLNSLLHSSGTGKKYFVLSFDKKERYLILQNTIKTLLLDPRCNTTLSTLPNEYILSLPYGGYFEYDLPDLQIGYLTCHTDEASVLAHAFHGDSLEFKRFDNSACPTDSWLEDFKSCVNNKPLILINIGVNKGYNFANWINVFAHQTGITPSLWHETLRQASKSNLDLCGACKDCHVNFYLEGTEVVYRNISLVGVDLNSLNINLLESTIRTLKTTHDFKNITFNLQLAGVSDKEANVTVKCGSDLGNEECQLNGARRLLDIPIMTGDKIIDNLYNQAENKTNFSVDLIQIDTEGHDPLVLTGLRNSLKKNLIKILIFEYHNLGLWLKYQLSKIVVELDELGYNCFFMGQNRLWKLTKCWHEIYEFYSWSNVMCILRTDYCLDKNLKKYYVNVEVKTNK